MKREQSMTIETTARAVDAPEVLAALADELRASLPAQTLTILSARRLSGGAVQENWALRLHVDGGEQRWVLRTDAPSAVGASLGRQQEFAVLQRVHQAGVRVPRPVLEVARSAALGRPYFLMECIDGIAAGHRLTRERDAVPDPAALLEDLATTLASLHRIAPTAGELDFLPRSERSPALAAIAEYRRYLDTLEEPQPVLEWGLRWCERHVPASLPLRLIHRDFRTGNYLVDQGRLSGVLDWEFTAFGDPREDLGWFSARCWRFAAPGNEAGGIGDLRAFLDAYRRAGGLAVEPAELVYWQVMAHLRWGVIALQQAQRHLSGQERSLELALTGRLLPDLEIEILSLTRETP